MKITIPGQDVPFLIGPSVNPDWYPVLKYLEKLQPLSDIDNTALLATIAATYSPILRVLNPQTGTTYTFAASDSGKYCRFTNASPVTVTIPLNATVAIPVGAQIDGVSGGAGKVTFSPTGGVTVNSLFSNKSLAGLGAGFTLVKIATNEWDLSGSLIA